MPVFHQDHARPGRAGEGRVVEEQVCLAPLRPEVGLQGLLRRVRGLDPEKLYRVALEVQPTMASNPLLPWPLPAFEEVDR